MKYKSMRDFETRRYNDINKDYAFTKEGFLELSAKCNFQEERIRLFWEEIEGLNKTNETLVNEKEEI